MRREDQKQYFIYICACTISIAGRGVYNHVFILLLLFWHFKHQIENTLQDVPLLLCTIHSCIAFFNHLYQIIVVLEGSIFSSFIFLIPAVEGTGHSLHKDACHLQSKFPEVCLSFYSLFTIIYEESACCGHSFQCKFSSSIL